MPPRGEYGYDAPYALVILASLAVVSGLGAAIAWWRMPTQPAVLLTLYFVLFLANAATFLYTTRRGKFLEWERILDHLHLRGDEMVLDMGCGRGAVLTAVACRLTTGRVTGVDIWSTKDQSGNAKDVALRNGSLEGVSDRVHFRSGGFEPGDTQYSIECRSQAGDHRRVPGHQTRRENGDRRYTRHGDICGRSAGARRIERTAPTVGVEVLVGQSGGGHNPPHGCKIPGLTSDNSQEEKGKSKWTRSS